MSSPLPPAIEFIGVDKRFRVKGSSSELLAATQVTFDVAEGEVVSLIGPSGCGKSTLQRQLMEHRGRALYCNFEDTRLYGLAPTDFPALISAMEERKSGGGAVYLDEVQEVPGWERLVHHCSGICSF